MLNCTTFALRKGDAPPSTMQAARNYYRVASGDVRLDDVSSLGSAVLTAGFDFGERSLFCPQPVAVRCVSAAAEVQAPDATVMAAALCELGLSLRFLRHFAAKFGRRYLLSLGHLRSAFRMPEEIALPRQRPDAEANDLALRDVFALPDEACLRGACLFTHSLALSSWSQWAFASGCVLTPDSLARSLTHRSSLPLQALWHRGGGRHAATDTETLVLPLEGEGVTDQKGAQPSYFQILPLRSLNLL